MNTWTGIGVWQTVNQILSSPKLVAERCRSENDLLELTRVSLVMTLLCTAFFGLVLGSHRDLEQSLMAATKLPTVWLLTLALCAPGFYAIAAAFGAGFRLRTLLALTLSATARAAAVLLALCPVLWFLSDALPNTARSYHQLMFAAALIYGFAGVFGVALLMRAFRASLRSLAVMAGFAALFFAVLGQTAWSLRPFVGRPAQAEVPWFRAPEGTFLDAVIVTSRSARGGYDQPERTEY